MIAALAMVSTACNETKSSSARPSGTTSGAAPAAPAASGARHAAATTAPSAKAGALTHLATTKPGPSTAKCTDLAKTHKPDAQQLAHVLRRLTCEPDLYFKPIAEVRAALALQSGYELEFSGPRTASLKFPKTIKLTELSRVMEVPKPVATMARTGSWRRRIWYLGSDAKTGDLNIWGPGRAMIDVDVDYSSLAKGADVTPLTDDNELEGTATITMPKSVVPVKHDAVGMKVLLAGLTAIGADRTLLSAEPEDIAARAKLTGERFRISTRSIGSARSGTDVWTQRTRIDADVLIEELGLKGKISHRQVRDADDFLLYDGSDSSHKYKGLSLTLSFDKRDDGTFELNGITLN